MNENRENIILNIFRENLYFFVPYLAFLITSTVCIIVFPKGSDVLFLNGLNSSLLDPFFRISTFIGDGIFYLMILVPMAIFRLRFPVIGFISFISSGLAAQLLKRIFDQPRPKLFFENIGNVNLLHFVPSVDVYSHHSMPSGHSASAFSMFLLLSIIIPEKRLGALFFFFALNVGLSRIYLLQHFLQDVVVGSILGVIFTILTVYLFQNMKKLRNAKWHNISLIEKFRKKSF